VEVLSLLDLEIYTVNSPHGRVPVHVQAIESLLVEKLLDIRDELGSAFFSSGHFRIMKAELVVASDGVQQFGFALLQIFRSATDIKSSLKRTFGR
jgi:hypothetical protein